MRPGTHPAPAGCGDARIVRESCRSRDGYHRNPRHGTRKGIDCACRTSQQRQAHSSTDAICVYANRIDKCCAGGPTFRKHAEACCGPACCHGPCTGSRNGRPRLTGCGAACRQRCPETCRTRLLFHASTFACRRSCTCRAGCAYCAYSARCASRFSQSRRAPDFTSADDRDSANVFCALI